MSVTSACFAAEVVVWGYTACKFLVGNTGVDTATTAPAPGVRQNDGALT